MKNEVKSTRTNPAVINLLAAVDLGALRAEVVQGLSGKQKSIPSKFFYDEKGSQLFEEITRLPEYYPTRTEKSILMNIDLSIVGEEAELNVFELGSGDSSKITILLDQLENEFIENMTYYPVDFSPSALLNSADILGERFPALDVQPIAADFTRQLRDLPSPAKRIFCFLGSTLGNFSTAEAHAFMHELGEVMEVGESLLLGLDMVKDVDVLEQAYNDSKGVTAAFNRNILNSVNSLLDTRLSEEDFDHLARYDQQEQRIEMYLKAKKDLVMDSSLIRENILIEEGELLHTEYSHKYSEHDIHMLAEQAGLTVETVFSDEKDWCSVVHMRK